MSTGATPDPVSGEMSQLISGLGVGQEQTLQGSRGFLEGPAFYPVIGADPPNNQPVNLASLPIGVISTASADRSQSLPPWRCSPRLSSCWAWYGRRRNRM
jgi:hypothetical protein